MKTGGMILVPNESSSVKFRLIGYDIPEGGYSINASIVQTSDRFLQVWIYQRHTFCIERILVFLIVHGFYKHLQNLQNLHLEQIQHNSQQTEATSFLWWVGLDSSYKMEFNGLLSASVTFTLCPPKSWTYNVF